MDNDICIDAFIVVYYKSYAASSLREFDRLLLSTNLPYHITAVLINPSLAPSDFPGSSCIAGGTNEFEGLKHALEFAKERGRASYYIFANDTFCMHRKWNKSIRQKFSSKLRLSAQHRNSICGELNTFGELFQISGQKSSSWISTYLFGISKDLAHSHGDMFDMPTTSKLIIGIDDQNTIIWGNGISKNLGDHIQNWMFPTAKKHGWYKSSSATKEEKIAKVRRILQEKYLSALLLGANPKVFKVIPAATHTILVRKAKVIIKHILRFAGFDHLIINRVLR